MTTASNSNNSNDVNSNIGIGKRARLGMLLAVIATIVAKFAALGSQFALGWLLAPEDFAVYAIAISYSSFITAVKNGGVEKILIQKGEDYSRLFSSSLTCAFAINLFIAVIIISISYFVADIYQAKELEQVMWIIALSIPIGTFSLIFQAKLSIDLRFSETAKISMASAISRHVSMVIFALTGLGPLSFVLPLLLTALIESGLSYSYLGKLPRLTSVKWNEIKQVLYSAKWIMLSTLFTAINIHGDYFILSFFVSKTMLGIYFFSIQLTYGISALMAYALRTVMLPVFSSLKTDKKRAKEAYAKTVGVYSIGAGLVCLNFAVVAPELISIIWQGKWDETAFAVQVLSLSLIVRLVTTLSRTMLESVGLWKKVTFFLIIDGVCTLLAAFLGASCGGIEVIAVVVGGYRVLFGVIYNMYVGNVLGFSYKEIIRLSLPVVTVSVLIFIAFNQIALLKNTYGIIFLKLTATTLLYSLAVLLLLKNDGKRLLGVVHELCAGLFPLKKVG